MSVGGLPSNISLLVAALDLSMIRSIRGAIRANLIAKGGVEGPLGTVEMPGPFPGATLHPEPRFEPRPVHHPTPRFEPRPVHHPDPVIERPATVAPMEPERPSRLAQPLLPPWKQLQPPLEASATVIVKYVASGPDQQVRGTILDVFL